MENNVQTFRTLSFGIKVKTLFVLENLDYLRCARSFDVYLFAF